MDTPLHRIEFTVNGARCRGEAPSRMLLVDFLREHLGLTGTHAGCEHGVCGACTILVNGDAVRSCLMFAVQANGMELTTVEGLNQDGSLSPLQASFKRHHALQCGFCTPGMLISATALLAECPRPNADQVRDAISGNLCRCTGYVPIVEAILDASQETACAVSSVNPSKEPQSPT